MKKTFIALLITFLSITNVYAESNKIILSCNKSELQYNETATCTGRITYSGNVGGISGSIKADEGIELILPATYVENFYDVINEDPYDMYSLIYKDGDYVSNPQNSAFIEFKIKNTTIETTKASIKLINNYVTVGMEERDPASLSNASTIISLNPISSNEVDEDSEVVDDNNKSDDKNTTTTEKEPPSTGATLSIIVIIALLIISRFIYKYTKKNNRLSI